MKKTAFFGVPRFLLAALMTCTGIMAQTLTIPSLSQIAFARPSLNSNQQPSITHLQVAPNSYNPLSKAQITLSFNAKNIQGEHFDAVILDSNPEMIVAWGGRELKEGTNTIIWNPPEGLENGTYTFEVTTSSDSNTKKTNKINFQINRPGYKKLMINNLKLDQNTYKLSSQTPLTLSFNAQNAQNRHYTAFVVDSQGGVVEQWNDQSLQDGVNTVHWWGSSHAPIKPGTYTFGITTPLASNSKSYSVNFTIKK